MTGLLAQASPGIPQTVTALYPEQVSVPTRAGPLGEAET